MCARCVCVWVYHVLLPVCQASLNQGLTGGAAQVLTSARIPPQPTRLSQSPDYLLKSCPCAPALLFCSSLCHTTSSLAFFKIEPAVASSPA
ncbi:hypothetical protein AOQ84DRAFT_118734 [Glonium stellatum]|uniref:Secreted protein n=1 Tax=Glonium stellatum TaxID=574774 RepID=A0A8E2FA64_9PEZI|nr:hypothetical protein AOQ84DRAFT_118734 [Glonium stellatum]